MRRGALGWLLLASTVTACSAERVRPDLPRPSLSKSVAPTALPGAKAAAPAGERIDLESFAPLLAEARFEAAARALQAGDAAEAARAAEAVLRAGAEKGSEAASRGDPERPRQVSLLVARLAEQAMDLPRALSLYDAATAPPGWTLSGYAALGAARVESALSHPQEALKRLEGVPGEGPIAVLGDELRAEALLATGSRDASLSVLRRVVTSGDRRVASGAALRLASLLLDGAQGTPAPPQDVIEALGLARRAVVSTALLGTRAGEARALEARALSALSVEDRRSLARPKDEDQLALVAALVDSRQLEAGRAAAEELLRALGPSARWSTVGCEAELQRARALAGLRDWKAASELAADASRHCKDADIRARALYLAGKYAEGEARYADAIRFYSSLEKEYPEHRLADDARFRAALSYGELGAEARFTELITRMPDDYPDGDMVLDAMFELSARRLGKGDWAGAALTLERASSLPHAMSTERGQEFSYRERYFRARAWGALGQTDRAHAEYEAIIEGAPLSYYMLQAYTRLEGADPARARAALERGISSGKEHPFETPDRKELSLPGFHRALSLLGVSDVENAERELDALFERDTTPPELAWAIALLYARADSAWLSHRVIQGLPRDWLGRWPAGDFRKPWEIAFPRPFRDLVKRAADKNGITEALVYAIMREESSFDPGAESPARAYGLMQLIEPTARQFGRPLGLRGDREALERPAINIAIGCRVLGALSARFVDNPLLAIPGYNAGPSASRRWLDARPDADFDVWVELIPYGETRRYTKRVLSSRATYAFLYDREHAESALKLPVKVKSAPARQ